MYRPNEEPEQGPGEKTHLEQDMDDMFESPPDDTEEEDSDDDEEDE